jgi:vitamin B12 transporter
LRTLITSTAVGLFLAWASPGLAAETADINELVVTATRLPALVAEAPDARVIDRQEIDLRQAGFAADIQQLIPGISLSRNGAFGGVTGVRMRGASVDKTLVLIDGVVQNDASQPSGGYDFANLDLSDIDRVEVLSGPQGSLWGSDAIGGVIAFTTREEDGWRANLEGGSYGTARGSAAIGRRTDDWALSASVSGYRADGVSKADGFPEKDGYWSWTAGLAGRVDLSSAVSLDGRIRYNQSRADLDGYDPVFFTFGDTAEYSPSKSWTGLARATVKDPWGFTHQFSFNGYRLDRGFLGSAFPSTYWADRRDWRWTAEHGAPSDRWGVAFGLERDDTTATLSTGDRAKLGNSSAFITARVQPMERLTLSGSVRYDDPSGHPGRATAKAAAVVDLWMGFSLTADWGQGFKAPTISQTLCDFCSLPGPALGLKPERAEGWDIGLRWRSEDGRVEADVIGFRLAVRDQIAYVDLGGFNFRYVNLDSTLATGVEADITARLTDQLTLKAEYAYTDAVDRTTGARLIRVPEHAGSVSLLWAGRKLSAALTVRAEGEQADSDPSTFSPAIRRGFAVADIAAGYRLTDKVELTARVENLTDRHYHEAIGYGEPRRAVYFGVRLKD